MMYKSYKVVTLLSIIAILSCNCRELHQEIFKSNKKLLSSENRDESNSQEVVNLEGKILLLEDLDGKEGRLDGNFCDIVAYDINNGKRYIITEDNFYDDHPSYSALYNSIFFESKRIGAHAFTGLTSASNIFNLELNTNIIKQVDKDEFRKKFVDIISDDNEWPTVNNTGDKLSIMNYSDNGIYFFRLIIYDIDQDSTYLLVDSLLFARDFTWSSDDNYIFYTDLEEYDIWEKRDNIYSINIHSKEKRIILGLNNSAKELGDCLGNQLLFIEKQLDTNELNLMVINLSNLEPHKIVDLNLYGYDEIRDPVFYNESEVFLICTNYISKDRNDEDIYLLNMETLKMKQVTFTQNIKDELSFIK